jgi:hypothetical protein
MTNQYITKQEKIANRIKEVMKTTPAEPVPFALFARSMAFDLGVKEKDVLTFLDIAIELGYFDRVGDIIVSKRIEPETKHL